MTNENVKQLPAGWTELPIEELLLPLVDGRTLHQGWSPQCEKKSSQAENEWGILKTTAIQAGAFLPEHNKRLPEGLSPRPLLEVKAGDILITSAGPRNRCGVACLVRNTRRRLMISGKMYRFRSRPQRVDPRYMEAFLQTAEAQASIDRMKTGGNESGLNLTHGRFRKLLVPVAPLDQQERIVSEIEKQFSRLDEAVANLNRIAAKVSSYRNSALGSVCDGETVRRPLGSLLREPLRNGHSAKAVMSGNGVPTFTLSAVTEGDFSNRNVKQTTANPNRIRDLWVKSGDIFVERSNTPELVGTARLYRGKDDRAIFPDLLIRVRVAASVLPEWVELCLISPPLRRYFKSRAQGIAGTMPKIDQDVVNEALIPVPSVAVQRRVVAEVERCFSVIAELEAQARIGLARAARLHLSILARAFHAD